MNGTGIVVGENGRRSGLAIARVGQFELRILILPKAWRPAVKNEGEEKKREFAYEYAKERGCDCFSVIAYENDRLNLGSMLSKEQTKLLPSLLNCIGCITGIAQDKVDRIANELKKKRNIDDDTEVDPDKIEEVKKSALVRPFSGKNPQKASGPDSSPQNDPNFQTLWQDFYLLWEFTRDLRNYESFRDQLGNLNDLTGSISATPLLAPFLHRQFVSTVEELLGHVRPGYSRVTKPSRFIRGRLDLSSAAMVAEGGGISCVCTFDEFSLDTPILQVICAALRVVSDAKLKLKPLPGTVETAAWLLEHFEAVKPINDLAALRIGLGLANRLPKAEAEWEDALGLACFILEREQGLSPTVGPQTAAFGWSNEKQNGYVFDLDTAVIWEKIVKQACENPKSADAIHPWRRKINDGTLTSGGMGRGMLPDVTYTTDETDENSPRVILDAKYQDLPAKKPTSASQRQMYVYAGELPGNTVSCLLVYLYIKDNKPDVLYTSAGGKTVSLRCIGMRFPDHKVVKSRRAWDKYKAKFKRTLRIRIKCALCELARLSFP